MKHCHKRYWENYRTSRRAMYRSSESKQATQAIYQLQPRTFLWCRLKDVSCFIMKSTIPPREIAYAAIEHPKLNEVRCPGITLTRTKQLL